MSQYVGTNPPLTSDFNDTSNKPHSYFHVPVSCVSGVLRKINLLTPNAITVECHSKYNFTPWPEVYPSSTIVEAARPGRPLVVDVGGEEGHVPRKFFAWHPDVPAGSLILQDLQGILKEVETGSSEAAIEAQPHDFITPQRVKGLRVYFMHDWPDATAAQILRDIAAGVERDDSRAADPREPGQQHQASAARLRLRRRYDGVPGGP